MKTIGRDFGDVARKVYATASGTLPNGKPVIVNSDGTVSVVSGADQALGSEVFFESANAQYYAVTFDSNSNKVVIAFSDFANSYYGTAVVGTVSGTSITFGTPVVYQSARVYYQSATFDSNANKIVIAYRNVGNNGYGTAIVGTVSGTNISFGTAVVFESALTNLSGATFDSNSNKVVIAYSDAVNSNYGTAVVGTVSGTNISFGTPVVFESAATQGGNSASISLTFDSNSNKVVIAYCDSGNNSYGTAIVGTVSGTSISFGTAVTWGVESTYVQVTFDSNSNKVVVAYRDNNDGSKGKALVGTVSGTSISFGSAVVFSAGYFLGGITFDSNANKVVIVYMDTSNNYYGTVISGSVSGTSITFDTSVVVNAQTTNDNLATFDSNSNKVVIVYRKHNTSPTQNYGASKVFQTASTNITAENYIGMTPSAYPSGAGAEIDTKGAINTEQSGLTAGQSYFVQTDGTITTTAGDPSVFAGTAVSATKLIVKG